MDKNLTKIREWTEFDGSDPDEWPAPPQYTEYRAEGQMRSDILARLDRPADDPSTIRVVTGVIEGGYSEYTVEHDYPIEVWIDGDGQSQRVFDHESSSEGQCLPALMRWISTPDNLKMGWF